MWFKVGVSSGPGVNNPLYEFDSHNTKNKWVKDRTLCAFYFNVALRENCIPNNDSFLVLRYTESNIRENIMLNLNKNYQCSFF